MPAYDPSIWIAPARILVDATMEPIQGTRFQPTGFPNLGAAQYQLSDGTEMLLVESAQSMANRLEATAWDEGTDDLVEALRGIPYVRVKVGGVETDTIREAHRLNSPYLAQIWPDLRLRAGIPETKKEEGSANVDRRKLASAVFYYDPNSVLHGVFLEKIVGGARLTRMLSAFIEARGVKIAASGGVKNDRLDPSGKEIGSGAAAGFGNVPFSRTEYVAESITASFSLDTTLLRSYGLPSAASELLVSLGLWKISHFLDGDARLRTACDLKVNKVSVTAPSVSALPSSADLEASIRRSIEACNSDGLFAKPAITTVEYKAKG
jgi:CRISPR-associated protein Csb1